MNQKKYLLYISKNYSFINLRALAKEIVTRGDLAYWFVDSSDVNTDYFDKSEVRLKSVNEVNTWKPDAVLVPGNYVPHYIKGLKVAVFHGFNVQKRSDVKGHFNIRGCFDLYCTQGPNTTEPFQKLAQQHGYFSVQETGWAAVDELFNGGEPNANFLKVNPKPTILLCSTFTASLSCALTVFETVKALSATGTYQWMVQFHPKMDKEIVNAYKSLQGEHLTFIETDNMNPYLQQADVMLCDTSSIISMFLLLNKPVVTFNNAAPKPYFINIQKVDEIAKSLALALTKPEKLMIEIQKFVDTTHPYTDGKSAERVISAINDRLTDKTQEYKRKPLNLLRELKKRSKDNYWKFW